MWNAAVEELTDMVDSLCLGPSTASIVDAADDRDIPAIRLLEDGNLVQIGYAAAMRRIWTAEPTAPAPSPKPSRATRISPSRC